MQIHIGQHIREELRQQGHTNEWLAERIQRPSPHRPKDIPQAHY